MENQVKIYVPKGDYVHCSECSNTILLPYGADRCPICGAEDGEMTLIDDQQQGVSCNTLLEQGHTLTAMPELTPNLYLSKRILRKEFPDIFAQYYVPEPERESILRSFPFIDDDDFSFLAGIQNDFNSSMAQPRKTFRKLKSMVQKEDNPYIIHLPDLSRIVTLCNEENFRCFEFSFLYDILHIERLITDCITRFHNIIADYFKKKYNVTFNYLRIMLENCFQDIEPSTHYKCSQYTCLIPSFADFLSAIVLELGNDKKALSNRVLEELKDKIRTIAGIHHGTSNVNVKVTGTSLLFSNVKGLFEYGTTDYSKVALLISGVDYILNKRLKGTFLLYNSMGANILSVNKILDHIQSISITQKHNIRIKLTSKKLCNQFVSTFLPELE